MRNKHSARRRFGKPLLGSRKVGRRACDQNSCNSLGTVTYECFSAPASKLSCSQSLRASIRLVAEQSLVQIRPPQLEVFSFQLLRDTLQPSALIIRPAQRRQGRECEGLSLGDEDEYVGKWPATPEQCGDFIQADFPVPIRISQSPLLPVCRPYTPG